MTDQVYGTVLKRSSNAILRCETSQRIRTTLDFSEFCLSVTARTHALHRYKLGVTLLQKSTWPGEQFYSQSLSETADTKNVRSAPFGDITPAVTKYRRHTLQKQPLCSMCLANKPQQLNYERRQNSLAVNLSFRPLEKDAGAVRPKEYRPVQLEGVISSQNCKMCQ